MPNVTALLFREGDEIPVLDWMDGLDREPRERLFRRIELLRQQGHTARRPLVENLGGNIYELRTRIGTVNYRMLFSFDGRTAVLLTSGFTKEREIPAEELRRARRRLQEYQQDPANHYAEIEE